MQYTPRYNLNLPEGTDIVNPLVQDNPNYSAIDTAMYANKLRVIGTATELASGTVHALTRYDTDINAFKFVATADFNTGDTFTVDGVSVTARRSDGSQMKNKAYVINSTVLCILDGTILNFIGVDGVVDSEDVSFDNTGTNLSATDVEGAIKEVADRGKVSVTSDGVKTLGQILDLLYAQVDMSKITKDSKCIFAGAVLTLSYKSPTSLRYMRLINATSTLNTEDYIISSTSTAYVSSVGANTYSRIDDTNTVQPSGYTYELYY